MADFEYLGMVNIGQYLPLDSWLHRIDARARIVVYFLIIMALTFAPKLGGLGLGLLIVLFLLKIGRVPIGFALRSLVPPLPFILILAVLQIFITPAGSDTPLYSAGFLSIHLSGILAAARLLLRFAALVLALGLASYTLSTAEMLQGLQSLLSPFTRIGLPTHDFVMILQVTIRFIPFLAQAAERIAKAQAARGADWGTRRGNLLQRVRQVVPLIIPLFLTSLRRAEAMALAMDARGYGGPAKRTSMLVMHMRASDGVIIFIGVLAFAAVLFLPWPI